MPLKRVKLNLKFVFIELMDVSFIHFKTTMDHVNKGAVHYLLLISILVRKIQVLITNKYLQLLPVLV